MAPIELFESRIQFRRFNKMSTFKYKSGAQKRKEKKKINKTISKHGKISEFFNIRRKK